MRIVLIACRKNTNPFLDLLLFHKAATLLFLATCLTPTNIACNLTPPIEFWVYITMGWEWSLVVIKVLLNKKNPRSMTHWSWVLQCNLTRSTKSTVSCNGGPSRSSGGKSRSKSLKQLLFVEGFTFLNFSCSISL